MALAERPLRIIVAVSGGIAAYKSVLVVRQLVLAGHDVSVIATESALRFVGAPTFEAISHRPINVDVFEDVSAVKHVALGQEADVIGVVPATAATLARLAHGLAEDLIGTTVLASRAPLVLAPAMHTEMWEHPATRANVELLRQRGAHIVGPASGRLTGSDTGVGRLAEPDEIVQAILAAPGGRHDLAGRTIVVTAGGTREPLDPVRFIGNRSSGRQGLELARAAYERGADVHLIACNIAADFPSGVHVHEASTTAELRDAVSAAASYADTVIMAAAVADYRPAVASDQKIKRTGDGGGTTLELVENPDILAELSTAKKPGQTIVGFAAETEADPDLRLDIGRAKRERKGCDFLAINFVDWDTGFGNNDNSVVIINRHGDIVCEATGSKRHVADLLLDAIVPE